HLVACRECAALLADLEGLGDPDFGADEEIPEDFGEKVWEGVRKEVRQENVVRFPERRSRPWLQPLAATLLISTLALSGWVAHLRNQVKELSNPQLNAPILDLYPGSTRGEGPAVQTVPADARLFTLVLNRAGRGPTFEDYELEILDGQAVVLQEGGLKPNPYGSFSVTLSKDLLGPGDFRVRLVGIDSGQRQTIEEYALRIEGP
ncbi:MAG TPA: hypothetical protein VFR31_12490, partial [Thermoanaerobaculia bacterium]|nr:hypothetical protein [Thermoanaerobaculia bacterium]